MFTLALVVGGVAVFLYVFALLIELAVSGSLGSALVRRRTARSVKQLENHYIICGYGRVGQRIGREFRQTGLDYVVVDFNPESIKAARDLGDLVIEGSGTDARSLSEAGLATARGLVASSRLRRQQPLCHALGAGGAPEHVDRRAGGERGRSRQAQAGGRGPRRPAVCHSRAGDGEARRQAAGGSVPRHRHVRRRPDLSIEEIEVTAGSGKAGLSIRDLRIRHETGALVIAVQKPDGRFDATPSPDTGLEVGDVVIAVGTVAERDAEELFAEPE